MWRPCGPWSSRTSRPRTSRHSSGWRGTSWSAWRRRGCAPRRETDLFGALSVVPSSTIAAMVRTLPGSAQATRGGRLPDFLLVGAPKAGTTALHAALARHPELYLSPVKEPKYYLCGDSPPPAYRGPGDAHSNREWVWQRQRYLDLFAEAGDDQVAGESTPFYLYHRDARRRIANDLPRAKLVAVLRDPVDRAYSNWMHLWADGLEPCSDVVEACARESQRIDAGWAPFWHYRALGMYGRQLADLFEHFPREQVLIVRYRSLVEDPNTALNRGGRFLG